MDSSGSSGQWTAVDRDSASTVTHAAVDRRGHVTTHEKRYTLQLTTISLHKLTSVTLRRLISLHHIPSRFCVVRCPTTTRALHRPRSAVSCPTLTAAAAPLRSTCLPSLAARQRCIPPLPLVFFRLSCLFLPPFTSVRYLRRLCEKISAQSPTVAAMGATRCARSLSGG